MEKSVERGGSGTGGLVERTSNPELAGSYQTYFCGNFHGVTWSSG